MNYVRMVICGLLLVAVLSLRPTGQTTGKNLRNAQAPQSTAQADDRSKAVPREVQQRALAMLDSLWAATEALGRDKSRLYLKAQIADAMWDYDESRARLRFNDALLAASSSARANPNFRVVLLAGVEPESRAGLLKWIVERDPAWAKRLMLSDLNEGKTKGLDTELLLCLTDVDAPEAIKIMKQALDKKELSWLSNILEVLRRKDAAMADDLFSYALAAGPQANASPFRHFIILAGYAFPNAEASDTNSPLSPELLKRLFDFGYKALMQEADEVERELKGSQSMNERAGYDYMDVVGLTPFFERYAPEAAPKIAARWEAMLLAVKGGARGVHEIKVMVGPRSAQEALNNAERATDPEEKMASYTVAARKAVAAGDTDQALALLNRVPDTVRRELGQKIHEKALTTAIANGDAVTAYRLGKQAEDLHTRTRWLSQVAQLLYEKNQSDRATEVLNEAQKAVDKEEAGPDKVVCQLMIANVTSRFSSAKGFESMKKVVDAINRAKSADGKPTVAISYDDFDDNLLVLAEADFDRAMAMAKSITLKDAALIAQVAVCRGVLLQKKPSPKVKPW